MAETPPTRCCLTVRSEVRASDVEVSVSDLGPGLPADIMSTLFTPFVTTKSRGLGIGLTIARTIIDAHGGTIEARNNPDGGATFRHAARRSIGRLAIRSRRSHLTARVRERCRWRISAGRASSRAGVGGPPGMMTPLFSCRVRRIGALGAADREGFSPGTSVSCPHFVSPLSGQRQCRRGRSESRANRPAGFQPRQLRPAQATVVSRAADKSRRIYRNVSVASRNDC